METKDILRQILTEIRGHKELLSIREAAAYFDTSERSIRRFIKNKQIITIKEPGIGLRIVRSSIDEYIKKKVEAQAEKIKKENEYVNYIVKSALERHKNN